MTKSRAAHLVRESLVWDNHACMPLRPQDRTFLPELARVRRAGIDCISLNIGFGEQTVEDHIRMAALFRGWLAEHAADYRLAETADDIVQAREAGQLAVTFDIEGANAVADQLSLIQVYYDLGVRWMLLAYNRNSRAGSGCYEDIDAGLTEFGAAIIAEMERVGMVLCLSHTGRRTCLDALRVATKPVILSHSNANQVYPHKRNVDDEILRGVADSGGVACVNGISVFLGDGNAGIAALVRHLHYMLQLIGPAHVGLGLDYVFDPNELRGFQANTYSFPEPYGEIALVGHDQIVEIVEGLLALGYGDDIVRAVLGENLLRVARRAW